MTQRVKRAERRSRQKLREAEAALALQRHWEEGMRLDLSITEALARLDQLEAEERNAHLVPDGECRCECPSCEMDDQHHGPGEGNCQKPYVPK
jgi:hypothetical protein